MRILFLNLLLSLFFIQPTIASQSIILDTDGYACMGEDKSRKQTEDIAFKDAKRKASESASTYIQAETHLKDAMLDKDILSAYTNSQVKVIQEFIKEWYKEGTLGDCFRVKLKVEVVPDEQTMTTVARLKNNANLDDPTAPLSVKVWTEKTKYNTGEKIRVFVKGNRPFYGRVVYQDVSGTLVQILPNPYRKNSYFNGGAVYEIPSADDRFELEVSPPFGTEKITLFASTSPMGDVSLADAGGVYSVKLNADQLSSATRGVKFVNKGSGASQIAEFAESSQVMTTSD